MSHTAKSQKIGAVMVVGGGIAGIQASLDLAESGFFVHLVEKKSAIGGAMAQLNKTFPTNDCAMCTLAPKLVECGRHLNIQIHTLTEVKSITGEPGNFTATLEKQPRYIDPAKCTGCWECAKVCPVPMPDEFNQGLSQGKAAYRLYPQAIPGAFAIKKLDRAPCVRACPANLSAQGYVQLIKEHKFPEALALIMDRLPLPGTIGRICPHPCETDCRRQEVDEPIAICNLKRFVADAVDWDALPVPEVPRRSEKVAIVGAGPSGLSCAFHLALKGIQAVIFEAAPEPGGWLRYGIPEYRLPREVLQREVNYLQRLGVQINCNAPIGKDRTINDLLTRDGFNAVFLGVGAQDSVRIPVPGHESRGVLWGVEYLKDSAMGKKQNLAGKKVLVIGGGNVAMDVARTAVRQQGKVTLICLESPEEMPASPWEVEEAREEGVEIVNRWGVKQILEKGGKVTGIQLKAVARVFDEQGRFAPTYFEDQTRTADADVVIMAIGQKTNLQFLTEADGIQLTPRGLIQTDPETKATSREGVFAGGDVETGPYIAIAAVAAGREAGISIDRYLQGQDLKAGRQMPLKHLAKEEGQWSPVRADIEKKQRALMQTLPVEQWIKGFKEINLGYREEEAVAEAARCLNCGGCCECLECVAVCQAKAIVHSQRPETTELQVGAIILAPGYQLFDPHQKAEYGYGRYPNVITSLEFERILSPTGPTQAHVKRPSDGADPRKVAWIQCVGSRDPAHGRHYCSAVCCMYATKQALIAREHDAAIEPTIFFIDLRTHGKGFERYYQQAKEQYGVRYIRSMISRLAQDPQTHDLELTYVDESGQLQTEVFNLVVLSTGLEMGPETVALAQELGVDLSASNFVHTSCFTPVATSQPGIYACGAFTGPKDIPDSLMEGSAAAVSAGRDLAPARGSLVKIKEFPPEINVAGEPPRVGVFICHCGLNIAGVADIPSLVESARNLPDVAYVQANLFCCSQDAQNQMEEMIKEHQLNRMVVAACSPTTHAPIFQNVLREGRLNKYLFEMTNIRNQCTWVHQSEPERATEKCQDLIRMAVAKARLLKPLDYLSIGVNHVALVIGGGMAGMTASLALADQGYQVHLVERLDHLGGNARRLHTTWRKEPVQTYVEAQVQAVVKHPKITVHYGSILTEVSGAVGNYKSKLSTGREIDHGMVIIAIGAEPYRPEGLYLYKKHPNVLLSLDLDQELAQQSLRVKEARSVAFIQCVGSRIPERPYCNRLCCSHSVENALRLKELNPETQVYIIYRDLRTYGEREALYFEARQKGVVFLRYSLEEPPQVDGEGDRIRILVKDQNLKAPVEVTVDLLTLATAIIPHQNLPLAELYKVSLTADGFFMEAHAKIKPVESSTAGIFFAGLCHYPKPIQESLAEALACASRAATILSRDFLELESTISHVIDENCDGCAFCVDACPFKALTLFEYMKEGNVKKTVEVNATQCKGCGSCMATCPKQGICVDGFTMEQLEAQVDAALRLI